MLIIYTQQLNERKAQKARIRQRSSRPYALRVRLQHLGYTPSNAGKDWTEYDKEYKLRTDAVWEKWQLKNWYRLTNRVRIPLP